MIFLTALLMVLLMVLWIKVNQHSGDLHLLGKRLDALEKRVGESVRISRDHREEADEHRATVAVQAAPSALAPREPKPPISPPAHPVPAVPPRIPAAQPVPVSHAPGWQLPKFDWESLVGVKLFSWIAGVALLLAVLFFLGYAKSQGWLMPQTRMAIGLLAGIVLLALCEIKAARAVPGLFRPTRSFFYSCC